MKESEAVESVLYSIRQILSESIHTDVNKLSLILILSRDGVNNLRVAEGGFEKSRAQS